MPKEDLARISVLHDELKGELGNFEGYLTWRIAIEKLLVAPEGLPFTYKAGLSWFASREAVRNFSLEDLTQVYGRIELSFVYCVVPYGDWNPTDWFTIRFEGQRFGFNGGAHQESNKYSPYQGFADVKCPRKRNPDAVSFKIHFPTRVSTTAV